MSKEKKFLTIGVWVAILPFLGFPMGIKNILFVLTGLLIIYLSYGLYLESKKKGEEKESFDSFSENKDFNKTEKENNF
jgi:hypothetical protein